MGATEKDAEKGLMPVEGARNPVLDGLRGIAILLVIAFHLYLFGAFSPNVGPVEFAYSRLAGMGWAGVDLFFVLSGFLITGILFRMREKQGYFLVFYIHRILRIFPVYYLALFLFFFVAPVVLRLLHREDLLGIPLWQAPGLLLWTYLLNWQDFLPKTTPCSPLLQHFWSLAIEEQFYLAWPLVVRTWDRRTLMWLCAGMMVVSWGSRLHFSGLDMVKTAYGFTFCRLDGLAIGALVALAWVDAGDRARLSKFAPLAVNFGLFLLILAPQKYMVVAEIGLVVLIFGGMLVMALELQQGSSWHRFLSSGVLVFFGKYSYALYVFHQPVFILLRDSGLNAADMPPVLGSRFLTLAYVHAVYLCAATAVAYASWHLVEKHFLKMKERFRA